MILRKKSTGKKCELLSELRTDFRIIHFVDEWIILNVKSSSQNVRVYVGMFAL